MTPKRKGGGGEVDERLVEILKGINI